MRNKHNPGSKYPKSTVAAGWIQWALFMSALLIIISAGASNTPMADQNHSKNNLNQWEEYHNAIQPDQVTRTITGRVTDRNGESLPGVTVVAKGTMTGTVTDVDGRYSLNVPGNINILVFSFIGMETIEERIEGRTVINVTMAEITVGLDEIVVVGYGTQRRGNVTGSISTIRSEELERIPIPSVSNLLGGKLPGLISVQRSGQPGADAANLQIRGFGNALVIVDGVETNFNQIDANQIESITILKDGSASIYGARAGNGVILVTTKRGQVSKPIFTLNSSYTMSGITRMPDMASAGQYAELMREKHIQSGLPPETAPFTQEEVQKYYDGTDPQYPNTNWRKELTRDYAPQQQHNLSVRGGSESIKYFGLFGYLDQETMWKESGGRYQRYNLQSNIDAKILDNLTLEIDIAGRSEDRKFSSRSWSTTDRGALPNNIWGDLWNTTPTAPRSFPDPTKPVAAHHAEQIAGVNITANRDLWGYSDSYAEHYFGTLRLNYDFNTIKGLSANVFMNYLRNYSTQAGFNKAIKVYSYDYASDTYRTAAELVQTSLNIRNATDRTITGQLSLNYENTFGQDHNVTGFAMYEAIDSKNNWIRARRDGFLTTTIDQLFAGSAENMLSDGAGGEMGRVSYIGRFTYNYMQKYLFESTFRADASARFSEDQRWGYFPSVSLGWRITQEDFMQNLDALNELKLRTSYGRSGNDAVAAFQYLAGYAFARDYIFEGTRLEQAITSTGLPNPNLTWEEISIYNIGLDFSLFNRKLYGELEAFYRERNGIPANRLATVPITFGATLPQENINSLSNRGFELMLGTAGKATDFTWDLSGMVSWSRARWIYFEEPEYTDPDEIRINKNSGQWTDVRFGYLSDGLFISQEEIDNLGFDQDTRGNETLRPGDIRYVDTNDDGVLDWRDRVEIGKGITPNWMVGLSANASYKQFDLSFLIQGALGHYVNVDMYPSGQIPPAQLYDLRWSESNNDRNALVPRLGGSTLNNQLSDYRLIPGSYLRLKNLTFGYNLPRQIANNLKLNNLRIYFAGYNILTVDHLAKYGIDPETPNVNAGMYYPQPKTFVFGVNASF